jgi:protein-L-isoaspartate(D-aspartate) O-methyltransferase
MRVSSRNELSFDPKEKPFALNFGLTWLLVLLAVGVLGCGPAAPTATLAPPPPPGDTPVDETAADPYVEARQRMVQHQLRGRDITNEAVLAAMAQVPRHEFVPTDYLSEAYGDYPLPIGYGQTISQPYIVAVMTELVDIQPGEKVLEIGAGSGYQAAILAQLTDQVYTIEIIPELAQTAQDTFSRLGYTQIVAKQADGYGGWEDYAPFDAILVTAAPDHVPQPLVNQLADGGKMVIPIGPPGGYQSLWLLERQGDEVTRTNWGGVRFVPLTRSE